MQTYSSMKLKQVNKRDKDFYSKILHKFGERGLYEKAFGAGMINSAAEKDADIIILNLSESFFRLHRRTGNDDYAVIGKALRRAAHRVMRELIKQRSEKIPDARFLVQM